MKIVKTFMKAKLLDRFAIVTQKEVQKSVPKEALPAKFGGDNPLSSADCIKLWKDWAAVNEPRLRKTN